MDKTELVKKHTNNGFTLVELLITLAIFMILITVAIPSFSALVERNSISSTAYLLREIYNLARHEAVKRQQDVVLEPINSQLLAGNDYLWTEGARVYINQDGVAGFGNDDQLLRQYSLPQRVNVCWNNDVRFSVKATGAPNKSGSFGVFVNGNCAAPEVQLRVSRLGRMRTAK